MGGGDKTFVVGQIPLEAYFHQSPSRPAFKVCIFLQSISFRCRCYCNAAKLDGTIGANASVVMVVYTLLIISKAGGLIYNREFHAGLNKLSGNDYLVLAGTFHGVHAISRQISPIAASPTTGIEVLETALFRLQCFQTPTGVKFLLFTEPRQPNIDSIMQKIYELYADYVMKNPFYQNEMPIRVEKFDRGLEAYVRPRQ